MLGKAYLCQIFCQLTAFGYQDEGLDGSHYHQICGCPSFNVEVNSRDPVCLSQDPEIILTDFAQLLQVLSYNLVWGEVWRLKSIGAKSSKN